MKDNTNQRRVKEEYLDASIVERTSRISSFVDLGPADMCVIHKQSVNSKKNTDFGTFLYYTGVDTSNAASIAVHLQRLANLMTSKGQLWFGEKKHWKVLELHYCTYNALSKVDMRVTVHLPGKVETSVVRKDGKLTHNELSEEELELLWLETFVASMVRCLLDAEDEGSTRVGGLVEVRRINPFNNGDSSDTLVHNFMRGFEKLFWSGPKLGCGVEIPQPTLTSNYLVDGFIACVNITQKYDEALDILRRLEAVEPSVVALIAQVLLLKDEEIKAVEVMNEGIMRDKRDAELLLLQAEFCMEKKRYDLAFSIAKQAIRSAPSDYKTWATLVKVYTKLNDFENALLTLNSCPMNAHKEKYILRRVVPLRGGNDDLHLPSPADVTLEDVSNLHSSEISYEQRVLSPQLSNLPATNLKSTFASAYELLTEIVSKTGWESLLRYRAKVFVMEEEYRKDKSQQASKNASQNTITGNTNGNISQKDNHTYGEGETPQNNEETKATQYLEVNNTGESDEASSTKVLTSPKGDENSVQYSEDTMEEGLKKKRLCERWLDNLFMVLYEDLKAYTMWQAESIHFQAQQVDYRKTTLEWEVLGQVAFRLKHFKEGSIAFHNALNGRFSSKATREILSYYQMERSKFYLKNSTNSNPSYTHNFMKIVNQLNEKILECAIKLSVWNHRWYCDFSPTLIQAFSDLIDKEGLIKVQSLVLAVYSNNINKNEGGESGNKGITDMMEDLFVFFKRYKVKGADN